MHLALDLSPVETGRLDRVRAEEFGFPDADRNVSLFFSLHQGKLSAETGSPKLGPPTIKSIT